jgi:hypothetical protein
VRFGKSETCRAPQRRSQMEEQNPPAKKSHTVKMEKQQPIETSD